MTLEAKYVDIVLRDSAPCVTAIWCVQGDRYRRFTPEDVIEVIRHGIRFFVRDQGGHSFDIRVTPLESLCGARFAIEPAPEREDVLADLAQW